MNDSPHILQAFSEGVQQINNIKKHLVGKDIKQLEERLDKKIETVKTDLNKRIDRSNARLNVLIGIGITNIVILIIALFK